MPDTPSIVIVKSFAYRNLPEEYSNRYHFSGTTPSDYAAWKVLADAIINAEKTCFRSTTTWVRAYGYEAGTEHSVAQIDYAAPPNTIVAGTFSPGPQKVLPGDAAATVRWYTGQLNSRGKKIYCRKYFHDVEALSTGSADVLANTQVTVLAAFANKLIDGTLPGSFKYCGPQGAVLSAPQVHPWITTRTLKRRGKRPTP